MTSSLTGSGWFKAPSHAVDAPAFGGKCIRVNDALELPAWGVRETVILENVCCLQPEDIRACREYATQGVDHPVLVLAEL